ncbi:hypothetical protein ACFYM0_02865 [Streptomyces sp. NPDC006487]|uniref:hypothetical protein n=1 Tax=Streptomyces sp. NPDC006487 TaxID=3364748 RepID=UPI0036842856
MVGPPGIAQGKVGARKVVVTSRYGPHGTERLTFADVTDPTDIRYRHVQLVGLSADGSSYSPLTKGHAHAVVWSGDRLYVAGIGIGIGIGFDVFDTTRIWQTGPDTYVLPRVGSYAYTGAGRGCGTYAGLPERPCISAASLDLTGRSPALVTAQMNAGTGGPLAHLPASVVRRPIDPTTGVLKAGATGRVRAAGGVARDGRSRRGAGRQVGAVDEQVGLTVTDRDDEAELAARSAPQHGPRGGPPRFRPVRAPCSRVVVSGDRPSTHEGTQ